MSAAASALPLTRRLAQYAVQARYEALPEAVRTEAARGFMNWVGCVLGGCREPAVQIAAETVAELGGGPQAHIVGSPTGQRTDVASAAMVNCIASSIMAFDDAHLKTVTHPSGPVGAALLAFSERQPVSGTDFLGAFALGIELTCRLSNMLVLAPSRFNVGFYVTGLSGPIGVAAALGNLLRLDEERMNWALGLAASQSGGFRATHGTMTAHFRPGHAARCGVWSALLAARGFTGDNFSLEADKGFVDVFAAGADIGLALQGLGEQHELMANTYKPYPCGIVIHPILDACLDIRARARPGARITQVRMRVNPLALKLTDIRHPANTLESHVSLFHWAAAALVRGQAGLAEMQPECIADPPIVALRSLIEAQADAQVGKEQAVVEVAYDDGQTLSAQVQSARGSLARPMTDAELDAKFRGQAHPVLGEARSEALLALTRGTAAMRDVGREVFALMQPQ